MIHRKLFARLAVFGLVATAAAAVLVAKDRGLTVKLRDDCDPATFNAVLGPGACNPNTNGETTFAEFQAQFSEDHQVDDWEIDPDDGTVKTGAAVTLSNRGGETHTFTRVAHFGGGFVAQLNGNLAPRPECAQQTPGGLVPQPPSADNIFVPSGVTKPGPIAGSAHLPAGHITRFQCCIHPWMHTEIAVR